MNKLDVLTPDWASTFSCCSASQRRATLRRRLASTVLQRSDCICENLWLSETFGTWWQPIRIVVDVWTWIVYAALSTVMKSRRRSSRVHDILSVLQHHGILTFQASTARLWVFFFWSFIHMHENQSFWKTTVCVRTGKQGVCFGSLCLTSSFVPDVCR